MNNTWDSLTEQIGEITKEEYLFAIEILNRNLEQSKTPIDALTNADILNNLATSIDFYRVNSMKGVT